MTKFYYLNHGWANKYIWFDIESESDPKKDFVDMIKNGEIIFSKQSGTTFADLHCGTMAYHYFSNNLVNLLRKNGVNNFKAYKLKINKGLNPPQDYYYVEPISNIPYLKDIKVMDYIRKNNLTKKNILVKDQVIKKWYADLTKWDGSDLFRVKDFRHFIVTEKLKNVLEKSNLKNVTFEPIKTL